ncbi:DUF3618 domain-containing protein [Fodinicurvata sp. EGI_FJ10296]|uniref:DUF3618 domain-containing protein n=1 Tax=Fodinicurvata sp. EGI_FJ10296 TaxID=3231908 RepID=UPI0034538883
MTDGSNTNIRNPGKAPTGGPGSTVSTRSRDEIEKDIHERREQSGRSGGGPDRSPDKAPDTADIRDRTRHEAETHRAKHLGEPTPARRSPSDDRDKSSAELEREVEHERELLTRTLDDIREKLSLGQIMDQAVRYARESGGGEFTRNLGRSVRDNPLPVAFIGVGIGWHLLSGRMDHDGSDRSHGRYGIDSHGDSTHGSHGGGAVSSVRDRASSMGSQISDEASHAKDAISGAVASARGWVSSARGSADHARHGLSDRAHDVSHRASEMAGDARHRMHDVSDRAQNGIARMAREQPLVLGAIGLAAGAAIAAMFPPTRTENRVMGETSDMVKDEARSFAENEFDHAKTVAEETTQDVANEFKSRGLTPESAREATSAAAKRTEEGARRMAQDTKSDIGEPAGKSGDRASQSTGPGNAGPGNSGPGDSGAGSRSTGGTQAEPSRDRPDNAATTPNRPGTTPGSGSGSGGGSGGGPGGSPNTGR